MQNDKGNWRRSSHCVDHACVWVDIDANSDEVRVSPNPGAGDVLTFARDEWTAFLIGAKAGEFDLPRGR